MRQMDDGGAPGVCGRIPPFASLRAFDAVFRLGGIRKAAESLGLNHAVVSRHIQQLEAWMGGALVIREGNRLTLTEAGQAFHARVAGAISELADAVDQFTGMQDAAPLSLWCIPGLSMQWLASEIALFEREHVGRRIELKPTEKAANLANHEANADIRYYRDAGGAPVVGRGLRCFEIARPDVRPVASPALAENLADVISSGDWSSLPLLHEESDDEWRAWLDYNGFEVPGNLPGLKCWHAHLLVAAAREGRGVALASRILVHSEIETGKLVTIDLPNTIPVALGAYILTAREDRWSDASLSALRNRLRARAGAYLKW